MNTHHNHTGPIRVAAALTAVLLLAGGCSNDPNAGGAAAPFATTTSRPGLLPPRPTEAPPTTPEAQSEPEIQDAPEADNEPKTQAVGEPAPPTPTPAATPAETDGVTAQEGEWGGAETDDPVAVVDPVEVAVAGHSIAEPEPEQPTSEPEPEQPTSEPEPEQPTSEPEPEQPTSEPEPEQPTSEPEPEQPTSEPEPEQPTSEPEPEQPTSEPEPEPEPEPTPEPSLPDCAHPVVRATPCIDESGTEQSVESQRNRAFGGGYIGGDFYMDVLSAIGNHSRAHDVDTHRVTTYDPDWSTNALLDPTILAAVRPTARGDRPQPMSGHPHGHLPPFTPGLQAWSDWCFFDYEMTVKWPEKAGAPPSDSTFFCAQELHRMAFHLSHLDAAENCILPRATTLLETTEQRLTVSFTAPPGSPEYEEARLLAVAASYLHCPNVIYPDPDAVVTLEEHYALIERHGGADGTSFADFVASVRSLSVSGEPSQLLLRSIVFGRIPNFVLGV